MKRIVLVVLGVAVIAALAAGLTLGLRPRGYSSRVPALAVLPFPNTPDASPTSQISFFGLAPGDLTSLTVQGSKSGRHEGRLSALADGGGAAFVADQPFSEGESVSVTAELGSKKAAAAVGAPGEKQIAFAFSVAATPPTTTAPATTTTSAVPGSTPSATSATTPTTQLNVAPTQSFHSSPALKPPVLTVSTPDSDPGSGYVFVDSQFAPQNGPMILDGAGNVVWFDPLANNDWAMDVRVQSYAGKPVLTWWQGQVASSGHGEGSGVIVDTSYEPVATVHAAEGYSSDVHEFLLTSHDTAFMTVYQPAQADLTSVGGVADGAVLDGIAQEVDVKTGQVLWEWHALGHVPLTSTYAGKPTPGAPYDFFHINSIQETPDGNLLISARNTWAVYMINRKTGAIMWQLGGTGGSITLGPGVQFEWQHDARLLPDGTLTVFDNASSPEEEDRSRALHISADVAAQTSTLLASYMHTPGLLAGSQGNAQTLPNGNVFVGWGDRGAFSEFAPDGTMIFDVSLAKPAQTYRAYRSPWEGHPTQPPALSVSDAGGGDLTVYASWNGATGISSWQLLAGSAPDKLSPIGAAKSSGFETAIAASTSMPYLAVRALDSGGKALGTSNPVQR